MMDRRTFLGTMLGTFAATGLPWIAEEVIADSKVVGLIPALELPDGTKIKAPPIEMLTYIKRRGTTELFLASIRWEQPPELMDLIYSKVLFVNSSKVLYAAKVAAIGQQSGNSHTVVVNLPKGIAQSHSHFMQKLGETNIPYRRER